jgi:transposase-like protein
MVSVKPLDQLTLADLWREVRGEDTFWSDTAERQRTLVKHLLEGALEEEMVLLLEAARYRRVESRRGYRNGFYERDLATQIGIIKGVRVPRGRPGGQEREVFGRYQRRQAQVNVLIREIFLAGVSTRRVGEVLERLLGERVSAQTVSRVAQQLDREVERFHQAPLSDDVLYLLLDGVSMRVKGALGVKRRLVLCAYAITVGGQRRLLDFRLGRTESEAEWEAFLSQLRERGLWGRHLRLVVTDGCRGLHAALQTVYPYVGRQHCWVHKLRNVAALLPRRLQKECLTGVRRIYEASTKREAVQAYWAWAQRWRGEAPKAVACLERDLEELLSFFTCPPAHHRKVRTTNAIERAFREVRRRTRPMSCFNNGQSCERIIYAVVCHLNKSWEGHPLQQFTHNS